MAKDGSLSRQIKNTLHSSREDDPQPPLPSQTSQPPPPQNQQQTSHQILNHSQQTLLLPPTFSFAIIRSTQFPPPPPPPLHQSAPPSIPSQTTTLPTWAKIQAGDQFPSGRFGCWEHMVVCHVAKSEVGWHATGLKLAEAFFADGDFELFSFHDNKAIIIAASLDEQNFLCNGNHFLDEDELISLTPWNPWCNIIAENSSMVGWVGIAGLPFHLWNPAILTDIAKHFGTMIVVDENTIFS